MIHPGRTKDLPESIKNMFRNLEDNEHKYWQDKFEEDQKEVLALFAKKYGFYAEKMAVAIAFAYLEEQEEAWGFVDYLELSKSDMLAVAGEFERYIEELRDGNSFDNSPEYEDQRSDYNKFVGYLDFGYYHV
jgi:hypothetical protein